MLLTTNSFSLKSRYTAGFELITFLSKSFELSFDKLNSIYISPYFPSKSRSVSMVATLENVFSK